MPENTDNDSKTSKETKDDKTEDKPVKGNYYSNFFIVLTRDAAE